MQTLDSLVGQTSAPYVVNQMPEGQPPVTWTQNYALEQNPMPYVMNVIKPDHTPRRIMEQPPVPQPQSGSLPPTNPASVITATYNPTYNRCLPKILSDLDCEMKIKQVLKCIENILLDGSDLDPQQSYKLPDRSSSPQLVPKKKIKVKEDEDMTAMMGTNNAPGNIPKANATKSPVRINVKVEPSETEKAQRGANVGNTFQDQGAHQVPSASPRGQYDFSGTSRSPHTPSNNGFPKPQTPQRFSFEPYAYGTNSNAANAAAAAAAAQYMHQSFLQHPQVTQQQHSSLLLQQQHLQAVQQHLQAQQHLLNTVNSAGVMQMHPMLQHTPPQHLQYGLPQTNPQQNSQTHAQTTDAQQSVANQQTQIQENPSFNTQMDDFPFPVFSSTLEEANQFKTATREESKKPGEADEQVFFFGSSPAHSALWNASQMQPDSGQQLMPQGAEPSLQDQLRASGLGSSALLQQGGLPLLFQMPQLTGLEEDDKWILSLLNIDGIHETNPNTTGF